METFQKKMGKGGKTGGAGGKREGAGRPPKHGEEQFAAAGAGRPKTQSQSNKETEYASSDVEAAERAKAKSKGYGKSAVGKGRPQKIEETDVPQSDIEALRRREEKRQTANVAGLRPTDFVKLLKKENMKLSIGQDLGNKMKRLPPKERQELYDAVEQFSKTKKLPDIPKKESDLFNEVAADLNFNLHKTLRAPELHEIQEITPKNSNEFEAKAALSQIQQPTGLPIAQTFAAPVPQKLVKEDNAQAKKNPVQGESNAPIESRLNMKPTDNPSENAVPNQAIHGGSSSAAFASKPSGFLETQSFMGAQSNAVQFSQYNGAIPIINPQLLGQTKKEQNDRLNVNSASAGIPPSAIMKQSGETTSEAEQKEPEFEKHQRENQPVNSQGGFDMFGYKSSEQESGQSESESQRPLFQKKTPLMRERERLQAQGRQQVQGQDPNQRPRQQQQQQQQQQPPNDQNKQIRERYTPEQLAVLRAQEDDRKLQELEEANADKEQNKSIGFREATGLSTRFSRAGADIVVKPQEEINKSIQTFANFTWIPKGARNDSKLTFNSSLQKMWDANDELRFYDTYNPQIEIQQTPQEVFEEHRDEIKKYTNNRFISQSDSIQLRDSQSVGQNLVFGKRPAMARPPTLYDLGDYTYSHNGVVGTTNLGFVNEKIFNRPDYDCDTLHFPDVIIERDSGIMKYI